MAGCLGKGVKCYLNGDQIKIKSFKDYSKMYVTGVGENLPFIYERVGERWEVAVSVADGKFQQISFVNSINTMNGGQHVNYITTQLISKLQTLIKKKHKGRIQHRNSATFLTHAVDNSGLSVKPYHIKNHLWVFINCLVENPAFDSQTKFTLTTRKNKFGSTCNISDKYLTLMLTSWSANLPLPVTAPVISLLPQFCNCPQLIIISNVTSSYEDGFYGSCAQIRSLQAVEGTKKERWKKVTCSQTSSEEGSQSFTR
eukprot:221567-Amorphochlora_amoeboformis.AAC.1